MKYLQRFSPLREEQNEPGDKGGGGSAVTTPPAKAPDWRESIPEDLRNNPAIKDFKDVGDLVKSYVHQQPLIGTDKIPAPKDTWTEKDWTEHYARIGRPDSPDKYEVPKVEGAEMPEEEQKEMLADLHAAGLTNKQAKTLLQKRMEKRAEFKQIQEDQTNQKLSEFKEKLGEEFEPTLNMARKMVQEFGDDDTKKYLEESGLGNSPELIQFLAKAAKGLMEDGSKGTGGPGNSHFSTSPDVELKDRMQDEKFVNALYDSNHPQHQWAVETRANLLKKSNPAKIAFT